MAYSSSFEKTSSLSRSAANKLHCDVCNLSFKTEQVYFIDGVCH